MKYRKSAAVIEAFKYDGDLKDSDGKYYVPAWAVKAFENNKMYYGTLDLDIPSYELFIDAYIGTHHVCVGDYVIQGVLGELYPCDPDIFENTYEKIE